MPEAIGAIGAIGGGRRTLCICNSGCGFLSGVTISNESAGVDNTICLCFETSTQLPEEGTAAALSDADGLVQLPSVAEESGTLPKSGRSGMLSGGSVLMLAAVKMVPCEDDEDDVAACLSASWLLVLTS